MRTLLFCLLALLGLSATAQTSTSWKGTVSTSWANAANWTNGIPNSSKAVVIGDASYAGPYAPSIASSSSCAGLTVQGSTLTLNKNLSVSGSVSISGTGAIRQGKSTITVSGNWTNYGTFSYSANQAALIFTGSAAVISGNATAFRRVTINANAVVSANTAFTAQTGITLNGTLVPAATVSIASNITVGASGTLKVTAANFSGASGTGNYAGTVTLSAGSTVEYNSAGAQTVSSAPSYSNLRISGAGTRSLAANLTALGTSNATYGNLYVDGGILDLKGFTANHSSTVGGTLSLANGTKLLLSGASNFPTSFNTYALGYTSTVEYYGAAQTVAAKTYGNLTLSGSGTTPLPGGTVVSNAFTTSGSVVVTPGGKLTVSNGSSIGSGTSLTGSSDTLTLGGGLANAGTINCSTGTVTLSGAGATMSGSGTFTFNNLNVVASGISIAASVPSVTVGGNLSTTGSGVLTYASGTVSMSGTNKTISGSNITLNNLTVGGSVSSAAGFTLTGNLAVSGSFSNAGILVMSGASKTITGIGSISFNTLSATGSLSTNTTFSIANTLDVTGSLTASAGTVNFSNTSATCLFNGTANLYNVALLNTTKLQLAANSTLGIAGAFTPGSGTFIATSTIPNTVVYNGGAQNVAGVTYDNLTLSNGGTKTATGALVTNTDLTIAAGTTFAAGNFIDTVKGAWNNSGTFTPGGSTVVFGGGNDATLTGATTFNVLTLNKAAATNSVFLANNMTAPTLNMVNGVLRTGSNRISVTGTVAYSNGSHLFGTIERTQSGGFSSGTAYAFESAQNLLTFTGASGISGVTVTVTQANVSGFPFGSAINRTYALSLAAGTYSTAALSLHYEDGELNGNSEAGLQLYRYGGSSWTSAGASGSSATSNYVEQTGLANVTGTWTLSATANVVNWNGSVSNDWSNPANWTYVQGTPSYPPSLNDIAQIGVAAYNAANQPKISTAATAKSILLGSAQAATLSLAAGGSLVTQGNISGSWSAGATHTLSVGAQTVTVGGNILLSDGTSGHDINLAIGTGTVSLTGSLTQSGAAGISFTGAGNLTIGGDYTYSSGSFSAGSGTVTYNGGNFQSVGGVTYNQLVIDKTAATASTNPLANTSVTGTLTVKAGTFDFSGPTSILGDVTVQSGAFATNRTTIQVGGNWYNYGTYLPNGGMATFNGSGDQTITATAFNKLVINKASGIASLAGNITLNSDLLVTAGTLDLKTFSAARNTIGGTLQVADGASLYVGGAANFPANYTYYTFGASSNTWYNGSVAQSVSGVSYGHLTLSNSGVKTLAAPATVQGNLAIGSGATFNGAAHNLSLYGNWSNNGSFVPATGAVLAMGTGKTISGNSTFNKLTVYGTYSVAGSDITYNGQLTIVSGGSYDAGTGTALLYGNLVNSGSLTSAGSTTFAGTAAQTIQLINAIVSTSTGVINFNGSVAPVLNSTSTPTFATLNINNTGGITPSVNWNVLVAFNVNAGATFNTGSSTHTVTGNFTNNGVVTGPGTMYFNPSSAKTAYLGANTGSNYFSSTGTVHFGGTGALSVTGTPGALNNVIIGNSSAVSPAANWTSIGGTFSIADNGVFNAGSYTYTLNGDMESNGTLNGGTSTFEFTSATAQISGSPNTTFYNATVKTGAALTINSEFNVSHDLTMNGSIDASLAGVTFNGAINGSLTGSAASLTLADFDVEKSSGNTLTLQKNVTGVADLNVTSGTLDIGALTLAQDATAGAVNTLTIDNYARLRIGGTSAIPAFTQYALDSFSVVEYNGITQAFTPSITYGSVEITAGTKTTSAALTVLKHFTISGGTFTGGAFTHSIGGDFTQTSPGVFTATGTTLLFNGLQAQNLSAASPLNIVTLNNALGLTLGSNVAVSGSLALSSGKLTLGNYNLTISSGTYTSSAANYVVATGSGALVLPIAAGAGKTFAVGTADAYLPATVTLNSPSLADNISVRVLPTAQLNGSSGGALSSYAVGATWMISEAVAGNLNATVQVQWPAASELPSFARSSCRLAHYTGGSWDYGTGALSAGTMSGGYSVSRGGFTSFSPFSVRMLNAVLPVTWTAFSGQRRAGSDELQWGTATESNNAGFTVEESADGRRFHAIAQVAGAGNSTTEQHYRYTRRGAQGTLYYRIQQTDLDGRSAYTSVIRLSDGNTVAGLQASFAGNPVRGNAALQLNAGGNGTVQLALYDAQGRMLWQQAQRLGAGVQTVTVPMDHRAAGVYFVTITDAEGSKQTVRLVKE